MLLTEFLPMALAESLPMLAVLLTESLPGLPVPLPVMPKYPEVIWASALEVAGAVSTCQLPLVSKEL